jgi:hypothetical protein
MHRLRHVTYGCLLAALLALGACAAPGGSSTSAKLAASPPSNYTYISGGDLTKDKNISLHVNTDLMDAKDPDEQLSLFFGLHFWGAMTDAVPAKKATRGGGLSVADPIMLTSADPKNELDEIGSYLVERFPSRDKIIGELYRSPEKRYVLWLRFETSEGPKAFYFDASGWAETHRKSYGG